VAIQSVSGRVSIEFQREIKEVIEKAYKGGGFVDFRLYQEIEVGNLLLYPFLEFWRFTITIKTSRFYPFGCRFEFSAKTENDVYKQAASAINAWSDSLPVPEPPNG
jgi:hypothetical protein